MAAARVRPPYVWLTLGGAAIGLGILGARLLSETGPTAGGTILGIAGAILLTAILAGVRSVRARERMRAASAAFPAAVLLPVTVGAATSVATRWLAERTGDAALHLRPGTPAVVAVDADGLHVVTSPRGPHGRLPAAALRLGPLGRTLIGVREVDALVLDVEVGDRVAPLPLVPQRPGAPWARLTDAELLEATARLESALDGRPVAPGWPF